jgi:ATP-dependent helicase IRC3
MNDEAHHASAEGYQTILKHFGVLEEGSHIKLWGCSATLRRHDGVSLSPTFQEIVYEMQVLQMLEEKWLLPLI